MKYFIIAGEASGDLHASHLIRELKICDPKAEFEFLGGDLMAAQGGKLVQHYRNMAFMGIISVLKNIRKILKNIHLAENALLEQQPDKLILVDYPSFNLRMAKFAKKHLAQTEIIYYISPKLWAWKTYRIKSIKRYINRMCTIFPFETDFYKKYDYQVHYVGNPTYDEIMTIQDHTKTDFIPFVEKNKLQTKPIIAILSGSRQQEIRSCLPKMLESAKIFHDYQIVIAGAPGIDSAFYQNITTDTPVVFGQTYDLLQNATAAVVNSGTATLETALFDVPQVVVYHTFGGRVATFVKKHLIKTEHVSLVNIIAQKEVVRELILHEFTVENVQNELHELLENKARRNKIKNGYAKIKEALGEKGVGAARNAATLICKEKQRT